MKHFSRLTALDGLRGFAIILVFLNHIPTSYLQPFLPSWLLGWIVSNGVTGVTFLFLLSGFLMYYIYPIPASGFAFLQKRYTRIFPLFLTMAAVMFTGRQMPNASWLVLLLLLLSYPVVTHFFWIKVIKKLPKIVGSSLFVTFFSLQIFVGFVYIFWINKLSFAAFSAYPFFHEASVFLVNATLTLPLGQYVPMLDGVYWSLVSEVLFYVLYPLVVVPLILFLLPKSRQIKIAFLVALFFLLGGIHILSYKIFVLSLVQPALFFYFAFGIVLAHLYKTRQDIFEKLAALFSGKFFLLPLILGFLTIMTVNDLSFLGQWISPWVRMLFALPIALCTAITLSTGTSLQKFFSSKWLLFLGMVSYSLYVSHTLFIHIAKMLYIPHTAVSELLFIIVTFLAECLIAFFLYTMLEKPYFAKDTHTLQVPAKKHRIVLRPQWLFVSICAVYILGVFAAYQSKDRFNFFSYVIPLSAGSFAQPKLAAGNARFALNKSTPTTIRFVATNNNLGLIALQLSHQHKQNNPNPQALLFTLTEKGSPKPLVQATYSLDQFNPGQSFPFGFPVISQSKGHTYVATLAATNPLSNDLVTVNPTSLKAIYAADKKTLLTHPMELFAFTASKFQNVFATPEALFVLLLLVPFGGFAIFSTKKAID